VCALDGFHVEIETSSGGVLADGGIARISQRARLPIAETCDIVLVTAEGLIFRGFELKGAELVVYDLPHNLV